MTKKQIITMLVNDQAERGIIDGGRIAYHIAYRMRTMSKAECEKWLASCVEHGFIKF